MRTPVGLDSTLGKTIPNGVAYHQIHHAGKVIKYQHKYIMIIKGARLYPEEDCPLRCGSSPQSININV